MIFFTESSDMNLEHSIDFRAYSIRKNRMFFIAKKQVHKWLTKSYSREFKGYFIVFNESFVKSDKLLLELFDFLDDEPFLDLDDSEVHVPMKLIELIQEDNEMIRKEYQQSLIEALLHFLVEKKKSSYSHMSINKKRFIILRKLIDQHYKDEKQVSFYAKKMDISVKRLDVVVKEVSCCSTAELIHQRVLLEAKRELSLGTSKVQDIASTLGYHDPSYFSRFFKKYVGVSPSVFMENNTSI